MKFLSTNVIAAGIGSAVIITFALLFYADLSRKVDISRTEQIGTITFKREIAHRKYGSQVVWETVEQNAPVFNNDSIRTAELSEAVIHLKDGTEIALNENSMIFLSLTQEEIDLQFTRGAITAKRDETGDEGARNLNITAMGTTVLLEKGGLNLIQAQEDLNLTVTRGLAKIITGEKEQLVKKDQNAVVAKDSKNITVVPLNLNLIAPDPNSHVVTTSRTERISFSWEPLPEKGVVSFELARDNSFSQPVVRRQVPGTSLSLSLGAGIYYWRLQARDRTGKVAQSQTRRISVVRDEPAQLLSPKNGATFPFVSMPPIIPFTWTTSDTASGYQLIIARDREFTNVVTKVRTPLNRIAVDTLTSGVYFWKVDHQYGISTLSQAPSSRVFRLTIENRSGFEAPEPVFPSDNESISRIVLEQHHVTFTWKKNPEIPATHFFLAEDKSFKNILFRGKSRVNFIKFDQSLPEGSYYWRVAGELSAGTMTKPSAPRKLNVIRTGDITLTLPVNNAILAAGESERFPTVRFAWQRTPLRGEFYLRLSRENNLSTAYREYRGEEYSTSIPGIEPGTYYWQVSLRDGSGAVLMKSPVQSIQVQKKLPLPMMVEPQDGSVVNMSERDALSLKWRAIEEATRYRITLHQVKGGQSYRILDEITTRTDFALRDLSKLDEGKFYWTLQAQVMEGRTNRVVNKSPVVRSDFEITLGTSMKFKLKLPDTIYPE